MYRFEGKLVTERVDANTRGWRGPNTFLVDQCLSTWFQSSFYFIIICLSIVVFEVTGNYRCSEMFISNVFCVKGILCCFEHIFYDFS